jgi:hypothetical protein
MECDAGVVKWEGTEKIKEESTSTSADVGKMPELQDPSHFLAMPSIMNEVTSSSVQITSTMLPMSAHPEMVLGSPAEINTSHFPPVNSLNEDVRSAF